MIIRGGENIYPKEIEDFLYTNPKVKDVQVIGVPDEQYGEEIMACVVLKEGETSSEEELKDFVRTHMAKHKVPRYIDFVDGFPMNAAGKILKYKMREDAVKKLQLRQKTAFDASTAGAPADFGVNAAVSTIRDKFGFVLPVEMRPDFREEVKRASEALGRSMNPEELYALFESEYIKLHTPYDLKKYRLFEENDLGGEVAVDFEGTVAVNGEAKKISGRGNGPVDAFFKALESIGVTEYKFVSYSEHAISKGADSKAVSYIHLERAGAALYGVGVDNNISLASIKGIVAAINRFERSR